MTVTVTVTLINHTVRFILYESEMTLNIKYPWPFQYQCQFYNFIVTPQVITRSHVQDTIIFLKVYDLATEFIRSIDFEIIRSFRWKYSNIQLKSFEIKIPKMLLNLYATLNDLTWPFYELVSIFQEEWPRYRLWLY